LSRSSGMKGIKEEGDVYRHTIVATSSSLSRKPKTKGIKR
jgi:hypothetical protein